MSSTNAIDPSPPSEPATKWATPADAATHTQPQAPSERRSYFGDKSAIYERGRQFAEAIAQPVARGEGRRAALRRVAADLGLLVQGHARVFRQRLGPGERGVIVDPLVPAPSAPALVRSVTPKELAGTTEGLIVG